MTAEGAQRYKRGVMAEFIAARFLNAKGYDIVAKRYKTRYGEIDLIAKRGNMIAFVEVKRRKDAQTAAYAVLPRAQARIANAARMWIAENPHTMECDIRFDVVLVTPYTVPQHIENAWHVEAGSW